MEIAIKISALALVGVITVVLLRKHLPEMSVAATLAVQIAIGVCAYSVCAAVLGYIKELAERAGVGVALLEPLFKCVGISVIIKLASDICRDNGVSSIASYVELIGGALAISYSIPLMQMIIEGILL